MLQVISHTPSRLIIGALVGAAVAVLLAAVLGWHALRRLFGVPRVPRPRATYMALVTLWAGMLALSGAAVVMALLLRDHQAVDGRTRLAELRCQAVGPGRVQMELTTTPSSATDQPSAPALAPERYEIQGDACVVSVMQIDLRSGLGILGPTRLSRIEGVGSQTGALERPRVNPEWLTPRASQRLAPINLLVHDARQTSLSVPAGGERFYLLASPSGPALEKASI
ncbi:MAG TPA: hypothetical protein VNO55_29110 [Polyangia bacterium]|nr:hypothetical protein [Polyangia bacterium]